MIQKHLFRWITRLAAHHTWAVLIGCAIITLVAIGLASTLDLKTNFKDTLGPNDPLSRQEEYLEQNFPAVTTIMLAIEGNERKKVVSVAERLKDSLLESPEVRAVYLEQPLDFFISHAALYVPVDDLRMLDAVTAEWEDNVRALLADPSFFKLIEVLEQVGAQQTKTDATMELMTSKMFGRGLVGQGPWNGLGLEMGISVDASKAQKLMDERWIETFRDSPLPPSQKEARALLQRANRILALIADIVDEGERLSPEQVSRRVDELLEIDLQKLVGVSRYRITEDGRMLLMEVSAKKNIARIDDTMKFQQLLQRHIDDILQENPDVTISMTGFPVILNEESSAMLNNLWLVTFLGLMGILAVFVIGFERVALPSLAGIPLVMGMAWTFGLQALVYGELTLFSMAVPVLFFGVGIDFAIHIMSNYVELRAAGEEPEGALGLTFEKVGSGILTGALTTAAAFLVLLVSDYYGLRQLGFTAGVGVLMALLAMLTALPPLLVLWDRRNARAQRPLPLVSFAALGKVGKGVRAHRYMVLAFFLFATVALAYNATGVGLDSNYMRSLPRDLPAIKTQDKILKRFGTANDNVILIVDTLEQAERARKEALAASTIADVLSPSSLIPPDQDKKRPYIEALSKRLESVLPHGEPVRHPYDEEELRILKDRVAKVKGSLLEYSLLAAVLYDQDTQELVGQLRDKVNRIDYRIKTVSADRFRYLDRLIERELQKTVALARQITGNTSVSEKDLPRSIVDRMQGKDGRWLVIARPRSNPFIDEFRTVLLKQLSGIDAEIAGQIPISHRTMHILKDEIPPLTTYIFIIVAILVLVGLRRIRGAILALIPLVVGIVWMVGIMGLLDMRFNLVSILAVPLTVGIGIDNGVHIYHRVRQERGLAKTLLHSGKAIILTSLTTGIGFGSLMLSIHPGFFSLGLVTTIGIFSCLFVSLFLLPALIAIFDEDTLSPDTD